MFIKGTQIKATPIGEGSGKYINCIIPYNESEMRNRREHKNKVAHVQTIRKDKLVEEPAGVTEFYH